MTAIEWHEVKGYAQQGSDRITEQHTAKYGKLFIWIEAHKWDEKGERYIYPRWLLWFQMADDLFDVYVHDVMFDTKQQAEEACQRLLDVLQ